MRCLTKTCPMKGRRTCPAVSDCPSAKKTINILNIPPIAFSETGYSLNLSPAEAMSLYRTLYGFVTNADKETWPNWLDGTTGTVKEYMYYYHPQSGTLFRESSKGMEVYVKEVSEWKEESTTHVDELETIAL